jgi:cellobiose-specific phosphotransferase system component IIA
MTHLNAADEQLSSGEAKTHLDEGIKALQSGDTDSAMTHIKAAKSALAGS